MAENIIDFPKTSAGRKIIRGLLQAVRYSRGDRTAGKAYVVHVPVKPRSEPVAAEDGSQATSGGQKPSGRL